MFNGTLFPQQKPAAAFLCNRKRVLLAWEQGTGKTIISIAAIAKLTQLGKVKRTLVLAPTSFAWQWEDKIKEFSDLSVTYVTRKDKDAREYTARDQEVYVVPWSLFRRDFEKITNVKWDIVIADEAQEFSNNRSVTADKMRQLNARVSPTYRWLLTGTAVSNKLEELYALLYVVDKGFLPPWPVFEKNHIVRNDFDVIEGYKDLKGLHEYLKYRVDRKTHADMAGEMPELLEQVITIEKDKAYEQAEATLLHELDSLVDNIVFDSEGNPNLPQASGVRKALHRVFESLYSQARHRAVLELVNKLLRENNDNRIVVFSQRKQPLYDLAKDLNSPWTEQAVFFTGDQTPEEKRENVEIFKAGKARVLLCSDAGNAGLDLPFARYLINAMVPLSYGKMDQRNKRITRLSSTFSTVIAFHFMVEEGIDQFFYNLVKSKGRLAKATLEGGVDEVIVRPISMRNWIRNDEPS